MMKIAENKIRPRVWRTSLQKSVHSNSPDSAQGQFASFVMELRLSYWP